MQNLKCFMTVKNVFIKIYGREIVLKTVGSQLKKLDDGIIFLTVRLQELEDKDEKESEEYKLLSKKLRALDEILDYVNKYKWVKNKNIIEKLKLCRGCGFDYNLIKEELNLSDSALKSFMFRVNKALNEKIGENTIGLILSDSAKWSEGVMQFRILSGTYSLADVLFKECYNDLPEKKFTTFSLKECIPEIEYIYTYSDIGRKRSREVLDNDKLAFLRFILESETEKYREDQKNLMLVLQGINISFEDFMKDLQDKIEVEIE